MAKNKWMIVIFLAVVLLSLIFIIRYYTQTPYITYEEEEAYTPEPLTKYGIPVDSLIMYEGVVLPRETIIEYSYAIQCKPCYR
jgi:hypothetical protein